uniref:Uncharacterized protein n=1 Tax=Desulfacinum infernum TaxID=35837 RepID=A0A832A271_9BACT
MKVEPKVVAAITAAVAFYMQAQAAQAAVETPPVARREPPKPTAPFSAWALSGRQSMMEMRRLWQMRLVR